MIETREQQSNRDRSRAKNPMDHVFRDNNNNRARQKGESIRQRRERDKY